MTQAPKSRLFFLSTIRAHNVSLIHKPAIPESLRKEEYLYHPPASLLVRSQPLCSTCSHQHGLGERLELGFGVAIDWEPIRGQSCVDCSLVELSTKRLE